MNIIYIFLVLIFIVYLFRTVKAQKKITQNKVLTKTQKVLNSILIWILPFAWYYIIKEMIEDDFVIMTKKKRDELLVKHDRNPHSHMGGDVGDF